MAAASFPPGFVWGAATAAYQIEGAASEDGRTPSIWDVFAAVPGNVLHGDTGEIACDHYHRVDEDLDLMASIGLRGYRFAPAWPRLQPGGRGPLNQRAVDHYRRLLDGLHDRGLEPKLTLYHWDLPQELQDDGGWPARDTAQRFAEYAGLMGEQFADAVPRWVTLNEPWCSAFLGYDLGMHAPGIRNEAAAVAAAHHLLLAHGLAVRALRSSGAGEVGITVNPCSVVAASGEPGDRAAAQRVDGNQNRWFLDPLFRGAYPEDMVEHHRAATDFSFVADGDMDLIREPIDFLGLNYYERHVVSADPTDSRRARKRPAGTARTALGMPIEPEGLREVLVRIATEYTRLPLYITESGAAFHDYVDPAGAVNDVERIAYLDAHFRAAADAIADGVDLRGYYVWSLLDNFEWQEGYSQRFGLAYVDYRTQMRIPKASARWYTEVIAANALP
jgi:beta-glucosidase